MTDIVERLRKFCKWPEPGDEIPNDLVFANVPDLKEAADEIERLRAAVEAARQEGFVVGGEEALLHALHPEFGSIYDEDGEATAAHKAGRREGIEAAADVASKRAASRHSTVAHCHSDRAKKHMQIRADEAGQLVADIRALLEDGR